MEPKSTVGKSFGYTTQIKDITVISKPSLFYLTSAIYPLEFIDNLISNTEGITGRSNTADDLGIYRFNQDTMKASVTDISGTLKVALKVYTTYKGEQDTDKLIGSITNISGILREVLLKYNINFENIIGTSKSISGILRSALILYTFYKEEKIIASTIDVQLAASALPSSYTSFIQGISSDNTNYVFSSNLYSTVLSEYSINSSTYQYSSNIVNLSFTEVLSTIDPYNVSLVFGKKTTTPVVVVNEYTTSALDFENDVIDQVGTTIWTKEGTADVTSINKIFGNNSFETKALGDSLYTNSNIITGGSMPFTIEFYALIKDKYGPAGYDAPLISQSKTTASGEQQLNWGRTIRNVYFYKSDNNMPSLSPVVGKYKFNYNEINKYTLTYDSSALRVFINDKLDSVNGTLYGWNKTDNPIRLLDSLVPTFESVRHGTKGLIDNINIHDGIATKVRDTDQYEDKLVVDLSFDGENNSTKIIDNGTLKSTWLVNGGAKISTDQKFDGFSSLFVDSGSYLGLSDLVDIGYDDFTLSVEIYLTTPIGSWNAICGNFDNSTINTWGLWRNNSGTVTFSTHNARYILSTTVLQQNTRYKIDVIRSNGTLYLYANNKLESTTPYSDVYISNNLKQVRIGYNNVIQDYCYGYIKNFKIYKGVAVVPENPVGKIQLDFDNNVTDKYGNSTWTNNGATFDQVNSVKGYSTSYTAGSYLSSNSTTDLNFGLGNFELSFDSKKNTLTSTAYLFSNNIVYNDSSNNSVWFYKGGVTNNFSYFDYKNKPENTTYNINNDFSNVWYNEKVHRKSGTLIQTKNGVTTLVHNINNQVFDLSLGGSLLLGKAQWANGDNGSFNGYIDNFKTTKDYQEPVVINKPAIHLPLETNIINTGFTSLTIDNVGSPTYTMVDGKKCIKFESGKYLTINSNNIFNLGTSSDFYLEFDFYPIKERAGFILFCSGSSNADSDLFTITCSELFLGESNKVYTYLAGTNYKFPGSFIYDKWNNLKIFRKGNITTYVLNDLSISFNNNMTFNYASNSNLTYIGNAAYASTIYYNGYMTNLKIFVGISEIPTSYSDKKVIDLDFKPTNKSYLFKDNNNKCIIHPVNITQRDYQDSQYCCTFNGTNQYLQLGKNDLLNFGLDDFVINIKFKITEYVSYDRVIFASGETDGNMLGRTCIFIASNTDTNGRVNKLSITVKLDLVYYTVTTTSQVSLNDIHNLIIKRVDTKLSIIMDDILEIEDLTTNLYTFNFNLNNNTIIGKYLVNDLASFKGTIYSIKVLRNTTDLTLLNTVEENTGSEVLPLAIYISNIADQYNPAEGSVLYVTGSILNSNALPALLATINNVEISPTYISIAPDTTIGSYTYSIGILLNGLEGNQDLVVTAYSDGEETTITRSFKVIRDVYLDRPSIDSFGTSWYQLNNNKPVVIRKYNEEPMMYFDGSGGLYSTNYSWRYGLGMFTIELDFVITYLPNNAYPYHILSYGKEYNMDSWYSLEITDTGIIRFNINKGSSIYISSSVGLIKTNTKYRVAITRDNTFTVRLFLNGIKIAEKVDSTNMDCSSPNAWFADSGNIMYLGRSGSLYNDISVEKHFKGYMKNIYMSKNECLYTQDYIPSDYNVGIGNKSLLSFSADDVNFTSKPDSFNSNITWTNTGCSVSNNELVLSTSTNKLLSSENNTYLLNSNNWTIDLVFSTGQIITESTLLDMRQSNTSYQGLLIKQSAADPTSITIYIGNETASQSYSYTINTGINSISANTVYNLKVVRSVGDILIFINGIRKNKVAINLSSVNTSNKVCLGNDLSFTKGFVGKIKQFRLINGTATDVYAFPVIEGETLK